jgi:epsilon-lactone hydrolase
MHENVSRRNLMTTFHPLSPEDAPVAAAMREAIGGQKGEIRGPEGRPAFDAMMAATPAATGISVEAGIVGGVSGYWSRPKDAAARTRVLYLHGGGYALGSAKAFVNFAGQITSRVGASAFIPDYRLAPEHAFPAAIEDVLSAYRGMIAEGAEKIVVVGDSAGGGLTLALLSSLASDPSRGSLQPVAAAVMSPWTDLTLTGSSMQTRAEADPIFTQDAFKTLADLYLQGHDPADPRASPLWATPLGLPPLRVDVGNDEILLDDAVRYAERAHAAGVDVALEIWIGMSHVFQSSVGHLVAAERSLDAIGAFLRKYL